MDKERNPAVLVAVIGVLSAVLVALVNGYFQLLVKKTPETAKSDQVKTVDTSSLAPQSSITQLPAAQPKKHWAAGHWVGTWTDAQLGENGTANWTIGEDGSLSGTIHNNKYDAETDVSGSIASSGQLTYTYDYGTGRHDGTGTLTLDTDGGSLKGPITISVNSEVLGTDEFNLSRQ